MEKICFIANKYPNEIDKNGLVFVQQLVWSIADLGIKCVVICPLAVNLNPRFLKIPYHVAEKTENNTAIDVYFPKFLGFGQSHYIFGKSPAPITTYFFTNSVIKVLKKNQITADAIYGHFAAPAGVCAARVGRKFNIPSFMAHGESTSWSIDQFGAARIKKEFDSLSGVIAVSSRNKKLLMEKKVVNEEKICVFPNGYRPERFYEIPKDIARDKLGWDKDKFIVGMVGSLIERKGPFRLQKAVESLPDVYFACAGKGDQKPGGDKCIFCGAIDNEDLVYFYNALDAFVLPTLNEGCCNAIVEAIACGCPIISSDLPFNFDICDKTNSILIDPIDITSIATAINRLKTDPVLLSDLKKGSENKSGTLALNKRAEGILEYIKDTCDKYED